MQISAAKSALHKTGQVILEGHLSHCVLTGIADGDTEKALKRQGQAVEQFFRMT